VSKEREAEDDVGHGQGDVPTDGAQMAASGDARPLRPQSGQDGQRLGDDRHRKDEHRPDAGRDRGECPCGYERRQRERSRQGTAQVVDHLPAGEAGHGIWPSPTGRVVIPAEDPGQELPVAACPAMLTNRRDQIVRWEFVEEFDVGHQPGSSEDALEKIVAQ
jgi:hypothetical protein